jgi:hypothetical protein
MPDSTPETPTYLMPDVDPDTPSIARTYDYLLGGKDNYACDRAIGDRLMRDMPGVQAIALDSRNALIRAVREIAAGTPIRQYVDLGSGLPTSDNVHQVAQRHAPDSRVVYVDNDPVVLAHGRALLEEDERTVVVRADLRDPASIRDNEEVRELIDFGQPVAVIFSSILHHFNDNERPAEAVAFWRDSVVPGSHFFVSHFRSLGDPESRALEEVLQAAYGRGRWRTDEEIATLLDGLEILPPGIVPSAEWRPDTAELVAGTDGVEPLPRPRPELTQWERLIASVLAVKP